MRCTTTASVFLLAASPQQEKAELAIGVPVAAEHKATTRVLHTLLGRICARLDCYALWHIHACDRQDVCLECVHGLGVVGVSNV
jgi:hypothetical protein